MSTSHKLYKLAIDKRTTPAELIVDALRRAGTVPDAAAELGMTRQALWLQITTNYPHLIDEFNLPQRVTAGK